MTEKVRIFDIETNMQFALELEGDQVVCFKPVSTHQIEMRLY
jgi:hypothetical protein